MRGWHGLACGMVLLVGMPTGAAAQTRSCNQVLAADLRQIVNARGENIVYFQDPIRLECTGNVTLSADSAIYNRSVLAMELVGNVVYRDSTNQLTSDWANYQGSLEQLLARGDVVLTNLEDGSMVTGQDLQYLRETATRPVSQVLMRGGRPRAVLRESRPAPLGPAPALPPPEADTAPPLEVTADRLEFLGDSIFLADGTVDIVRGGTTGASRSARYDQVGEQLTLEGDAHVRDERYRLEGERIDAFVQGEVLREVWAEERASLLSEELTVRSERLRIGFVEGALDDLEAWTPRGAMAERATALAEDFRLRADSIHAVADAGALREVRSIGRAYGERRLDSLAAGIPASIARDWIQGDTIIGYFEDALVPATGDPAGDSTEVILERVVAIGGGGPALSLYRMEPDAAGERGAINFMKASRIILFLTEGEVSRVEAEGPLEGVYMDPVASPGARPPDSGAAARGESGTGAGG